MTKQQLQILRTRFLAYADGYLAKAGLMRQMMELKREHCAFVARNCRELAQLLSWSEADINQAEALGLLHDIGRFPQLEEYGTFMDARSINHGERGWQAVQESDILAEIDPAQHAAVLNAVRYHNARNIPDDLPVAHVRWLKLIRDADRLDIYRVVHDAIVYDKLEDHPEIGLGLTLEGDPCPEVLESILNGEAPAYTDLKSFNDFLLLILGWINLMGYPQTLQMMRKRGVIDWFTARLPLDIDEVRHLVNKLRQTVDLA